MLRLSLMAVLLVLVLLTPVAWVALTCRGEGVENTYQSLLPPQHHRSEARTLLTYPEWHIVHAYDDYAKVIEADDPHDFGYFRAIRTYWTSLCALNKQAAALGGVDAETKQLVYVIGVSFSAEMVLKAVYEETLGRIATWVRGPEHSPLDRLSAQQAADYAAFLQQVPWYKWDFAGDISSLEGSKTETFRDKERRFALGVEYAGKQVYAGVIAGAVANVGADELTLRMIVKGRDVVALEAIEGVNVIAPHPAGTEVETIRYRALTRLLSGMAEQGFDVVEIAGNDDIMFTAISDRRTMPDTLFSFPRQGYGDYRHLFMVPVSKLMDTLRALKEQGIQVEHVHDY